MKPPEAYHVDGPVLETPEPKEGGDAWGETTFVGSRRPRVDAYERVSGTAVYPSDVALPGMLHAAILRCPHAHARVLSVDLKRARAMPGVRAVISGDSPEADMSWRYSRTSSTGLFDPHCRHQGETVAAVAADTPYQAWDAVRAIQVQYKVLPFVADEREAREPEAPLVYKKGNAREPQVYERGDVAKGFAEADVVLEETYRTECELHTPMELHGCVARWDGGRLTVWESSQGVFSSQRRIAEALELPLAKVRVIGHYMGGGFGSKLRPGKHTLIAAIMARKTGRPVKLFLTREETFWCIGNRPPATMRLKAGVRRDGTLTALEFDGLGSSGAYPSGGTSLLDWLVRDLYLCENVRTTTTDVFINAGPVRPFRAPATPRAPGPWSR